MAALSDLQVQRSVSALSEVLRSHKDKEEKERSVREHLKRVEGDSRYLINAEFPSGLEWLNTSDALSFSRQLKGKLVILDFFTYCCINCMHILPDLHALETRFQTEDRVLVIVGVHSAKFPNEKAASNIKNAILRYDITHPVVNDANIELWERLGVSCWPTLVFIGPNGRLIHYIIGEGHSEEMELFTEVSLAWFRERNLLSPDPIEMSLERDKQHSSGLCFPGKVACDDHTRLFVSDSSNHRILVVNRTSKQVETVFGSGKPGLKDGKGSEVEFRAPQGITYYKEALFVADTENHCIRKVNLSSGEVSTVLGTGRQGNDKEGGASGRDQEISSPWDVAVFPGPDCDHPNVLCIANAGTHQLWAYFLENSKWFKGRDHTQFTAVRMSGSGEEANRNNSFPHKASFAQPSGLALDQKTNTLFVADSESSTIRSVSTLNGAVKALIGGALDPMDLFAYGDKDGKGREVRLQHPLGVAWDPDNQLLYIADSYNHKIKACNPLAKTCYTLSGGSGVPGLRDGGMMEAQFSEPAGVCVTDGGKTLFVSDTNNHCIRKMDLEKKTVETIDISFHQIDSEFTDSSGVPYVPLIGQRAQRVTHPHTLGVVSTGEIITLKLEVHTAEGYKLHPEQESLWQIVPSESFSPESPTRGLLLQGTAEIRFSLLPEASSANFQVELIIYHCSVSDGVCLMHQAVLTVPLTSPAGPATIPPSKTLTVLYNVDGSH